MNNSENWTQEEISKFSSVLKLEEEDFLELKGIKKEISIINLYYNSGSGVSDDISIDMGNYEKYIDKFPHLENMIDCIFSQTDDVSVFMTNTLKELKVLNSNDIVKRKAKIESLL